MLRFAVVVRQKRGRDEERHYDMLPHPKGSSTLGRWRAAQTIGMVVRRRTICGCETTEVHDSLSSLPLGVKRFARGHWGIENRWHWSLDVVFAQDASRIRQDASPEIASLLRQLALRILQQDTRRSGSLRCKRKPAGWNKNHLESLLAQITAK